MISYIRRIEEKSEQFFNTLLKLMASAAFSDRLSPLAIAKFFLEKAQSEGRRFTPMSLNKLIYLSHGWSLGLLDKGLTSEKPQAWKFGPVYPSVYYRFKSFGGQPIDPSAAEHLPYDLADLGPGERHILNEVWRVYSELNGFQLSNLTHQKNSPWYYVWNAEGGRETRGAEIPDELIQEHYKALAGKS